MSRLSLAVWFALISFQTAIAQPEIDRVSGVLSHDSPVTIWGCQFGTKDNAAPLLWDDCRGTNILELWDRAVPDLASPSQYNTQYRDDGFRDVDAPHDRVQRFIAGGHAQSGYTNWSARRGPNVMVGKNYAPGTEHFYISFYHRLDPKWPPYNGESVSDVNHKLVNLADNTGCDLASNHYFGYSPNPEIDDAGYHTFGLDMSGYWPADHGMYADEPWDWVKIEVLGIDINDNSRGKLLIWTNNDLDFTRENMDVYGGTPTDIPIRCFGIGFYWARCNRCNPVLGSNDAFRYFADVYIDVTPARVILANHSDYNRATIVEPQIPTVWSDSLVTFTVNLGRLEESPAYLFVFDYRNRRNATGYPVEISPLHSPKRLRIRK